jgi:hypothetical protein
MELFKTDYLTIQYRPEDNYLQMNWTTTPSSSEFRKGMNELIEAMKSKNCGKVLTDTRKLGAISPEDQEWSSREWATEAAGAGFQHLAILMPEDIFGMMSVEDVMSNVDQEQVATHAFFKSELDAAGWLRNQN